MTTPWAPTSAKLMASAPEWAATNSGAGRIEMREIPKTNRPDASFEFSGEFGPGKF